MTQKKLKVGIDLDGVLADFRSAFLSRIGETTHPTRYDMSDLMPPSQLEALMHDLAKPSNADFWLNLKPLPGTVRLLELMDKHDCVFITSRSENGGKIDVALLACIWLEKVFRLPGVATVYVEDGQNSKARRILQSGLDAYIDDDPRVLVAIAAKSPSKCRRFLVDAPYNRDFTDPQFNAGLWTRVKDFNEFAEIVLAEERRKGQRRSLNTAHTPHRDYSRLLPDRRESSSADGTGTLTLKLPRGGSGKDGWKVSYTGPDPIPPPFDMSSLLAMGIHSGTAGKRTFSTGATRDTEKGKPRYGGFLSPLVIKRFGYYMNRHRTLADGTLRASDDWKKGMPQREYLESLFRHFVEAWRLFEKKEELLSKGKEMSSGDMERCHQLKEALENALCGMIFNDQGWLHELLKEDSTR